MVNKVNIYNLLYNYNDLKNAFFKIAVNLHLDLNLLVEIYWEKVGINQFRIIDRLIKNYFIINIDNLLVYFIHENTINKFCKAQIINFIYNNFDKQKFSNKFHDKAFIYFDYDFYKKKYTDIDGVNINTPLKCLLHWLYYGIDENRICNIIDDFLITRQFDWEYYIQQNNDLKFQNGLDSIRHWLTYGKYENRTYFKSKYYDWKFLNELINIEIITFQKNNNFFDYFINSQEVSNISDYISIHSNEINNNKNIIENNNNISVNNVNSNHTNPDSTMQIMENRKNREHNVTVWYRDFLSEIIKNSKKILEEKYYKIGLNKINFNNKYLCILENCPYNSSFTNDNLLSHNAYCDHFFVTYQEKCNQVNCIGLNYNKTWASNLNFLYNYIKKIDTNYEYYIFIDNSVKIIPNTNLNIFDQLILDLERYMPKVLTIYNNTLYDYKKLPKYGVHNFMFSNCGVKIYHKSVIDIFFPLPDYDWTWGYTDIANYINIMEIKFLGKVYCTCNLLMKIVHKNEINPNNENKLNWDKHKINKSIQKMHDYYSKNNNFINFSKFKNYYDLKNYINNIVLSS